MIARQSSHKTVIKITKSAITNDGPRLRGESLSRVKAHSVNEWITYRNKDRQGGAKVKQFDVGRVHLADKQETERI